MMLVVNDRRDQRDLLEWFHEIWDDTTLVEDVKEEVLRYPEPLYQNHCQECIYFKTLYHIFSRRVSPTRVMGHPSSLHA